MKAPTPVTEFSGWQHEHLFNIDFASYSLSYHSFPRHFHDHYVIELVLNGSDSFYCHGKNYRANRNQLVLINPGEVHTGSTTGDTPLCYFSFYPDKKALQEIATRLDITLPADLTFQKSVQDPSLLTQKLQLLFNSFTARASTFRQQEIFFDCMHEMLGQTGEKKGVMCKNKDSRVARLLDFIHTHYRDDTSLQQMGALVNLNPFHLVRLFKKNVGLSPYDYLLILRTEFAKRLLRKGYKVHEAAQESGFYDTSHLNRSVRKISGTSPKSFLSSKGQYRTSFTS